MPTSPKCILAAVFLVAGVGRRSEAQAIIDVSPRVPTTADQVRVAVADEGACIHYSTSGPAVQGNLVYITAQTITCPPVPPPGALNFLLTVGHLPAGNYEVLFQVDGSVVDSRDFTVVAPAASLTLQVGRFAVDLSWTKPDGMPGGAAAAVQTSDDCGYFWLFDTTDIDIVVKMVNGDLVNGKVWVFASSLTGQPFTLTITDQIGTVDSPCGFSQSPAACVKTYTSEGGTLESFVDLTAFPTR
jgi:hypothetical protein